MWSNISQLGNLKFYQNKFHALTIRRLTAKYTSTQDGDILDAAEKELWDPTNYGMNLNSDMRGLGLSGGRGFGVPGGGRGIMAVGVGADVGMGGVGEMGRGHVNQGAYEQKYEMFDMDEESQVWA
ncbi:hypothetical protein DL98DRAFT_519436 [Cadophora sp. DSE1049]|nr:hypothetical protein DL98DRAFT_519436 [Cadophora sp. DSE1049]